MYFLVLGIFLLVCLLLALRMFAGGRSAMLAQYSTLEKRFGFQRKTVGSLWGAGIGEHVSLSGDYRGYPVSLYDHHRGRGSSRVEWTSLVVETLFSGELELRIEFSGTMNNASFRELPGGRILWEEGGAALVTNRKEAEEFLLSDPVLGRLRDFAEKELCGAFSLSKGFLEYRETGEMKSDAMRVRFQEALLLLADLADAVSIYVAKSD